MCRRKLILLFLIACSPSPVLSGFGSDRSADGRRRPEPHNGVDLGPLLLGAPVLASADGIVDTIISTQRGGLAVLIKHRTGTDGTLDDDAVWTAYMHLETASVRTGQPVRRGQVIGTVGRFADSGTVTHVHWQLCTSPSCAFPLVRDPLQVSAGFFDNSNHYSAGQLTLPIRRQDLQ